MWVCYCCGWRFERPDVRHYREDMNGEGAYQDFYEELCPSCGEGFIEELEEVEEYAEEE